MEITTRLGIICPNCHKELEAKTKGIFGGLFFGQPFIHKVVERIKAEGAEITCGHCNHTWDYIPKKNRQKELVGFINKLSREVDKK